MTTTLQTGHAAGCVPRAIRRVLVVDDSRMQRRILSASLTRWGYEVVEAASGEAALEICRDDPPELILSDWMMPGMDGLAFLRAFRALPTERYGYFILLTSISEKGEVARGLDEGADDFLSKPVNAHELRARIAAGERILQMQNELTEKNRLVSDTLDELQRVYDEIDKDLLQARRIQQSLVPERVQRFGPSTLSVLLQPCGHVGGDLVGMFSPDGARLGFYSIDVSGHGITSALMTARVSGYLSRDFPDQNIAMEKRFDRFHALHDPELVAGLLNDRLAVDAGAVEYFTMIYAVADLKAGVVRMVQAGHPHPLLLRADGGTEYLGDGGLPVGLIPGVRYTGFTVQLAPGDRLLLYSDGITECRLADGSMLGPEGLVSLIRDDPGGTGDGGLLDRLHRRLRALADPAGFDDDVSAILLDYGGPPS